MHFNLWSFPAFVDAVLRLLNLQTTDGLTINLVFYDMARKIPPSKREMRWGGNEKEVWAYLGEEFIKRGMGSKFALFACMHGTEAPDYWKPLNDAELRERRVLLCKRRGSVNVAYLHLPTNAHRMAANHYEGRMRAVARILCPGPVSTIEAYPGQPVIPPVCFGLPAQRKADCTDTYGAVNFSNWSWLLAVSDFQTGKTTQIFTAESVVGKLCLHMPGWVTSGCLTYGDEDSLYENMVRIVAANTVPLGHQGAIDTIEVWIPGSDMLDPTKKGFVMRVGNDKDRNTVTSMAKVMMQEHKKHPVKPTWAAFRPVFKVYLATGEGENEDKAGSSSRKGWGTFSFDMETPLSVLKTGLRKIGLNVDGHLRIKQTRIVGAEDLGDPPHGMSKAKFVEQMNGRLDARPELHITPDTTEYEWKVLRNYICEARVTFAQSRPEDAPESESAAQCHQFE